ncbi:ATP-dependent DNA helicase [Trichonephila clavipes]|nr:ATP-dependent DNA helicase [Trichonephila clavipes]
MPQSNEQLADLHLKHERRALRASESDEQRALRLENLRVHATETRLSESSDQREVRLETDQIRTNQIRSSQTTELRERRLQNVQISTARSRRTLHADLNLSAFHYDTDDYAVVIRADKRPVGQHERQFNALTIDEVAIIIVGEEFESRDIILHRRNGDIQQVSETHRSYDGLQYPILFWRGDDGYHFNIKMINPQTEVPKFYTWKASTKKFQRRKQGKAVEGHTNLYSSDALGRLYTVHPNNTECFYLRLLLINIRGPISFQDLRTVNGQLCTTYRQACQELNLLENDAHWDTALADASNTARPQQIRTLFAIILTTCFPSNSKDLWEKYKDYMSEDILHRLYAANQNPDIQFTPNVDKEALILIEDICLTIANKALVQLGMPASNRPANNLFDRDLQRETL